MGIAEAFDTTLPLFNPQDFYGKHDKIADVCVLSFSKSVADKVLDKFETEIVAKSGTANGKICIYRLKESGVLFYLSPIGSAVAGTVLQEVHTLTGADKYVAFGSCGKKNVTVENDVTVEIVVKDYGTITLELYPKIAPKTVENFVNLAKAGFYDGLIFHRVISGFMIQGGDPLGNGMGGSDETIPGEFAANGFTDNTLKHTRGVISMARSASPNSAGSQFFIMHEDAPHLDGQYAAFGKMTDGFDTLDEIAAVDTDRSDRPRTEQKIKTIVIED